MADVEQMKKIVPFVTCEIPFGQNVCEMMFGVDVPDRNFGIKINRVKQQSKATLWVLDTCLIVGLRPFIILITASKTYNIALEPECVTLDGT